MKFQPLPLFTRPAILSTAFAILCHSALAASPPWLTANDDKIKAIVEKGREEAAANGIKFPSDHAGPSS